ncbi:MAG: undecaprenyldiphospho-muramoylpentapeptide beta-N-acetylglucosaminyltransferase [Micavibrio sp.]|nr:undecaprenyldiphospho-muramoylpentapeptide beta-N-acetylglucosaminyltransferase [Micavibrio sp.]|tara:strand:- start:486 stop:1598 length:1113 start_codon:yes stop_codon:yes gene_type:complete
MSDKGTTKILLSSGGTGGHVFPAIALASDLMSRGFEVHFATDTRGQSYLKNQESLEYTVLPSAALGTGISKKLMAVFNMGRGYMSAKKLLKKFKPDIVVGFGGYPSVPAVLAAQRAKIPTVLHEQNAILGKANLYLAPKAQRIALSLPGGKGLEDIDLIRAVHTGNPVRPEISNLYTKPYPTLQHDGPLHVLVFGGSQGASVFSEVLPEALRLLPETYRSRIRIVQQCRTEDEMGKLQKTYSEMNVPSECALFFNDMPERLASTHLVIARSGASTVAELSTAGRPAIFVPYPHHADQQQMRNAEAVAEKGGAWVMPESGFTAQALATRLETFLQHPETLFKAAEGTRDAARPDAARKLGNLVTAIALGWN